MSVDTRKQRKARKGWGTALFGVLSLLLAAMICPVVSSAQECEGLRPSPGKVDYAETDINLSARTIFRIGQAEGGYNNINNKEVKNLYEKYPNADKIAIKQMCIYMFCTILKESGWTTDRKLQEFTKFQQGWETVTNGNGKNGGVLYPDEFVGAWMTQFMDNRATFYLEQFDNEAKFAKFRSEGSLGRLFGGPNPLNATKWRVEGSQLVFYHVSQRAQDQPILVGKVRWINNSKFTLELTGGHWVEGNKTLIGKLIGFERL